MLSRYKARRGFYLRVLGVGIVIGAAMEFALIQSGYYRLLTVSEAKARAKENQELIEAQERFRSKEIRADKNIEGV